MVKSLLLICSLGVPQPDCSMATAEAVIQGPDAISLIECGLHGQAYIADGAIANYLDGHHYFKVTCTAGERLPASTTEPIAADRRSPGLTHAVP